MASFFLIGLVLTGCGDRAELPLSPAYRFQGAPAYVASGSWATLAPMPTARQDAVAGVIGGKLYVAGGYAGGAGNFPPYPKLRVLEVYDPSTDSWATKAELPIGVQGAMAGVINGKFYVAGGFASHTEGNELAILQVYNPATDTWEMKASMPVANGSGTAGVIDGKLYVVGSSDLDNVLRVYDPATNAWVQKASLPGAGSGMASEVIGGKLYVLGGSAPPCSYDQVPNCDLYGTLRVYDPATDAWDMSRAAMPTPRHILAVAVLNGRLHAVGGDVGDGAGPAFAGTATHEVYDPSTNTWTDEAPLLTARHSLVATVIDGRLFAVGGAAGAYPTTTFHNALEVTGKADQTISFDDLSNRSLGAPSFALNATASSGLPVSYAAAGTCTVTGNTVSITAVGFCGITADQAGDASFNAAPSVSKGFAVLYNTAAGHTFLQPIGSPPQAQSVFKAGSTIPVKFQLFMADGVTPVSTAVVTIQVSKLSSGVPDGTPISVVSTVPSAGTTFRYDAEAQQYIFNLATKNWSAGSYQITASLDDGSQITVTVGAR